MKPAKKAFEMTALELAAYIDHSVLKPEFTRQEIEEQILRGVEYNCMTVCVNPSSAQLALSLTAGTGTRVCVTCDFPFGLSDTASKAAQAEAICRLGIFELDVVANYGYLRSGLWDMARDDIKAVNEVCGNYGAPLKVILETDALTEDEIKKGAAIVAESGAAFVKSSTGFFTGGKTEGAALPVVRAMMDGAAGRCKIKASGGIRTREHFFALIDMGIDRAGVGYKSTALLLGLA
jgi:deoxyribose-phosphate aldolase